MIGASEDQMAAASRDARSLIGQLASTPTFVGGLDYSPVSTEAVAMFVARSIPLARCPHLTSPRPAIGRLALGRLDCQDCVSIAIDPPADDDDRCDWCQTHGFEFFIPVALRVGPFILIGDACDDCAFHLGADPR